MHCPHIIFSIVLSCLSLLNTLPARGELLADIRSSGRVRIAIAGEVPPFNFHTAQGKLTGSDPETAALLAQDLGARLELVSIGNAERISVLQERRADLVLSALSITPERERLIAFSVPYATIAVVIAAPAKMHLSSVLDLNGKTVGALAASSNLAHLRSNAPGARIIEYPENDRLAEAYLAGDFDIMSAPASIVEKTNTLKPRQPLQVHFTQMEFDIAIGLPKSEKPLRDWVNAWVVSRLQDGSLDTVYRKYHGHALPASIVPVRPKGKTLP
ncbi:transporter substrate-binding domain-containing protein [Uliginosibacterium sp. 31-12]|uniref:transporter substrate-binding domain-containing protein n=1 Tax=Uliginosibacterium sp. 31-12 TaxID=3062781 RepID=UPI0026E1397F|nr:transporter substrate-binding domain-containing protein [Uliginosibacterium sp. 31-12]MDO6384964.1 transporter substrate-binding domain-containing protein [Uliginosibacterium sp. 31-12]